MATVEQAGHKAIVRMPRINSNEDEAKVARIFVGEGEAFDAETLLFAIETTKAANDVEAPCAGQMVAMLVQEGDMVAVGAPLCHMILNDRTAAEGLDIAWVDSFDAAAVETDAGEARISTKAKLRARELGVDWTAMPVQGGPIRVKDVEAFHAAHGATAASIAVDAAPQLEDHYCAQDAIIFGGGGHARALMDVADGLGYFIIGALDNRLPAGTVVLGETVVLGDEERLADLLERGLNTAFVGVGGATSNAARAGVYAMLKAAGFRLPSLVSRAAHLGLGSLLGEATYLFPGANVGPAVRIGRNCIINQNVVVSHDSVIENDVHLAPNAVVAGHCHIGERTTIGMCATVMNGVRVGADCLIHNGVALTQDVPDGTIMTARGPLAR